MHVFFLIQFGDREPFISYVQDPAEKRLNDHDLPLAKLLNALAFSPNLLSQIHYVDMQQ